MTHVQVVVDHTLPIQLQRSAKLTISHWFYWSVYLAYQIFIFWQKRISSNHFHIHFLFTHNHLMTCSFSVVNPVAVTALF